jgi:hypothetical protein
MTYEFRPAKREKVPLLIGVAGGTGSGKTMSALRLARGLAGGKPFAGIDTENGRMNHYADLFPELHVAQITAPFRPDKYADAIQSAVALFPVVIVDSASHEWAGDGGCLDWHDELMGGDQKKNLSAWIEPKKSHKRMVTRLLQVDAHVILCFRAEPKVEVVAGNKIVPKQSLTGLDGWIPISEKNLPYELTASFLLMADKPGVPMPIKLNEQHRSMVSLAVPLSEETGGLLGAWAAGEGTPVVGAAAEAATPGVAAPLLASEDQRRSIADAAGAAGLTTTQAKAILLEVTGQDKTAGIPADRVEAVLAAIAFASAVPA